MGRDRIERDGSQEATQRGRARLMLKLPAVRSSFNIWRKGLRSTEFSKLTMRHARRWRGFARTSMAATV